MIMKHLIIIAILYQAASYVQAQDVNDYDTESKTEWSNGWETDTTGNVTKMCKEDCDRVCVQKCPEADLCSDSEMNCGKIDLPMGIWPDCTKDDICVPAGCECQTEGNDGSECPLWCETHCTENIQIKCAGGKDSNACKEADVCIDRPIGDDDQVCDGYCPVECDSETQHACTTPPIEGCPQAPTCEPNQVDNNGKYCDVQKCALTCDDEYEFCAGPEMGDGCFEEDVCILKPRSDSGAICEASSCPVTCDPTQEILCDGTVIFHGPQAGCKTQATCTSKAHNDNEGTYCPDNSDSHGCPITCKNETHPCPTRTNVDGCKEQATCTECSKNNEGECCPQASDCPALCQPHEKECHTPGDDDNGCALPPICVVQNRNYYGDLCTVHCPGVCNDGQIMCPGPTDGNGCQDPNFCEPLSKKLWGDDVGDWCPGFCPADCKEWEQLCSSVQDPCDGCPTEPVCKPQAKDTNGIVCPSASASHGCAISCKTLDGLETICPAFDDPTTPGCLDEFKCLPRLTGKDGNLCPSHSVCEVKCDYAEKQCAQGYDGNNCKEKDACIPVPKDEKNQYCLDFECPPKCDEEIQKYCQGQYRINEDGALCPERDYCVDRAIDNNGLRCPGHCKPECGEGYAAHPQTGSDARGCPLPEVCLVDE